MKKLFIIYLMLFFLFGCAPAVKIEAPDKPIVINLNINLKHEIRVKIEKDLDNLIKDEEGLFAQ